MTFPFVSKAPPEGWIVFDGQLRPDGSVRGYLARRVEVVGVCHQRDCRRRCHIDLHRLASEGFEALRVSELKPLFKCMRLGGCGLAFREEGGHPPTLRSLVGKDHVGVRFMCEGCRKQMTRPAAAVIARLKAQRTGDEGTPVTALPGLVRGPCRRCQGVRWRVDVMWKEG